MKIWFLTLLLIAYVFSAEVRPILECYQSIPSGFRAYFGYRADTPGATDPVPNTFRDNFGSNPIPTIFDAGRVRFATSADFYSVVSWAVSSGLVTVSGSETSYLCPTVMRIAVSSTGAVGGVTKNNIITGLGGGVDAEDINLNVRSDGGINTLTVEVSNNVDNFYNWIRNFNADKAAYWGTLGVTATNVNVLSTAREKLGIFLPSVRSCILNRFLSGYGICNERAQAYYNIDSELFINSNLDISENSVLDVSDRFVVYGSYTGRAFSRLTVQGTSFEVQGNFNVNSNEIIIQALSSFTSQTAFINTSSVYNFGNWRTTVGNLVLEDSFCFLSKGSSLQVAGDFTLTSSKGSTLLVGYNTPVQVAGELSADGVSLEIDVSVLDIGVIQRLTEPKKLISYGSIGTEFTSVTVREDLDFCLHLKNLDYAADGLYVTYEVVSDHTACDLVSSTSLFSTSLLALAIILY